MSERSRIANSALEGPAESNEFPHIPKKFSKLVTFKTSNRYINEIGRRGKFTKGSGKTSLIFDQMVELRKPKNTTNVVLEKLSTQPSSPNNKT